jgi:Zn finger protein HypA/HybF involved in hydrogenase expression
MANATLMQRYTEYNDRLKAQGVKLIAFDCPSCKQSIETHPAPKGEVWDTLSECPHCNAMFMKITKGKTAYGLIPEAPAKVSG